MSGSKISRFENGESGIYLDDLERLLDFYQLSKTKRVEFLDIARHAEQRGWLRLNNPNFPDDWQTWSDFEDEASNLRCFEPLMVPGYLQTPEYAREIIRATGSSLTAEKSEALVASRMARQGLLTRADPIGLQVIVEESVLRRPFGGEGAWQRQPRHLADMATFSNISVQVLEADVGLHPGLNGYSLFSSTTVSRVWCGLRAS